MPVPYSFGSATSAIPLSQLDSNFSTAITLGNTAIQLGNTVTTLNNMTLANVTISSGSTTLTNETISGNLTLSGGTANGVVYLNTSKVATSGTAFVFDGTNLGIGTSSPASALYVKRTAGNAGVYADYNGTNIGRLEAASNGNLYIGTTTGTGSVLLGTTANAAALELNNSGNLGLGVTPSAWLNTLGRVIQWSNGGSARGALFSDSNSSIWVASNVYYNSSGVATYINSNYANMYIQDGYSGGHRWFVAPSGTAEAAATFTQAMTLDASGNLLVGTTSVGSSNSNSFNFYQPNGTVYVNHVNGTTSTTNYAIFSYNGTLIGSISQNGTTGVLYNTSSDYRLKDITGPVTGAKDFIMALQPKQGTWKSDGSRFVGFVAHEFQEVSPSSVSGEKDAVDEDGNPIMQSMQASSPEVMANLVAFIQEQQAIIEQLKADVAALKGKA